MYSDRGDARMRERDRPAYRGGGSRVQHSTAHQGNSREREKRARWFVALFDYDPTTMSPNPDACEEELPFSEGDTIKVQFSRLFIHIGHNIHHKSLFTIYFL